MHTRLRTSKEHIIHRTGTLSHSLRLVHTENISPRYAHEGSFNMKVYAASGTTSTTDIAPKWTCGGAGCMSNATSSAFSEESRDSSAPEVGRSQFITKRDSNSYHKRTAHLDASQISTSTLGEASLSSRYVSSLQSTSPTKRLPAIPFPIRSRSHGTTTEAGPGIVELMNQKQRNKQSVNVIQV